MTDHPQTAPVSGRPLTAEDVALLRKGDILRVASSGDLIGANGLRVAPGTLVKFEDVSHGCVGILGDHWSRDNFTFIGRLDSEGWIAWSGGENPVPGQMVECRLKGPGIPDLAPIASEHMDWSEDVPGGSKIIAYRLGGNPNPCRVYVEVSGLTGTGKSAVMGEIEIALKALGLTVEHDADFQAEKNGTHADWQTALDLYKPTVVLRERNVARRPHVAPASSSDQPGR